MKHYHIHDEMLDACFIILMVEVTQISYQNKLNI